MNFEYFHSETRKIEPMCSKCHHKLTALSLDYSQELNNYRLKRIELRKEIKLAAQQKEFFVSERQIAEAKLEIVKNSLALTVAQRNEELEIWGEKVRALQMKKQGMERNLKDFVFRKGILRENFDSVSKCLHGMKKDKEADHKENEKLRIEYNNLTMKIAFLKNQISKDDTLGEPSMKFEDYSIEIEELTENFEISKKKVKAQQKNLNKLNKKISENNEKIQNLLTKLENLKENPNSGLCPEETNRLQELQKQLNDLDDLISILIERKDVVKVIQERKSEFQNNESQTFNNNSISPYSIILHPCEESIKTDPEIKTERNPTQNQESLKVPKNSKKEEKSKEEVKTRDCDKFCSHCFII